jgi:hypothetical protein
MQRAAAVVVGKGEQLLGIPFTIQKELYNVQVLVQIAYAKAVRKESALCASKTLRASRWPWIAAMCSGVCPVR